MALMITGANGFAGRHALAFFLEHTASPVICVDLKNTDQSQSDRVRYIDCDLGSFDAVRAMIKETHPKKMLHLAGISSVRYSLEQPVATIQANVNQALNLLEAIRVENAPTKVLMVSSGEVYGSPMNEEALRTETHALKPESPYAVSKAAIELIAGQYRKSYGMKTLVARPFNHTGPGQAETFALPSFAKKLVDIKLHDLEPVIYTGNIEIERDFLDVRDVVRAYHAVLEQGKVGETYNICSGKAQPLRWIVEEMIRRTGMDIEIRSDTKLERSVDIPLLVGSNAKITADTGWRPDIDLADTVRDLIDYWMKKLGD